MDHTAKNSHEERGDNDPQRAEKHKTSLTTLINWNVSKALEKNPDIDLKSAVRCVQERLNSCESHDVNAIISQNAEERHLACAILAWQELGHSSANSLCEFVESRWRQCKNKYQQKNNEACSKSSSGFSNNAEKPRCSCVNAQDSKCCITSYRNSYDSCSLIGPVVKLPKLAPVVMRLDNTPSQRRDRKPKAQEKDIMSKIDAACCMDTACVQRLSELDTVTAELRERAGCLARREAERVELLERAEAAWKNLELGYQRRLNLAVEKEEDMTKQIQKIIEERNGYKSACFELTKQLKTRGEAAEKDREKLNQIEKQICDRACVRLRLSEETAKGDAIVNEHQIKASQLERDLQFKEEQAKRKLSNFESEVESMKALVHEAERAIRSELAALREQIADVSNQLLHEESDSNNIKMELDDLRQEKLNMVEDLEGCQAMCDGRMQGKMDELKKKREQLAELKNTVMECQCKLPVDETIEAKRTPSLAALCACSPEDKFLESCSCTSLRTQLLSNLLSDLFGGLQAELGGLGAQMPCQLLKCLEDRHNWDKATIVKSNLRSFFSKLLVGELDIAIATSIEKYHAKWIGASCADAIKPTSDKGETENEGWQERAIERRAQKLANKLAEQLFQERADQLVQRAKDIVSSGPPPCECNPDTALFPCLITQPLLNIRETEDINTPIPSYLRKTFQDVTQLKVQIEDLKKESIKKEDLKLMEDKITKLVQRSSDPDSYKNETDIAEDNRKENRSHRSVNTEQVFKCLTNNSKLSSFKRKQTDLCSTLKKGNKQSFSNAPEKSPKLYKKLGHTYAVNVCLCGSQKDAQKSIKQPGSLQNDVSINNELKAPKVSKDTLPQSESVKQTKPINPKLIPPLEITSEKNKAPTDVSCQSNCVCFHKVPSNSSIDKLLKTLAKWKYDLNDFDNCKITCNADCLKDIYNKSRNLNDIQKQSFDNSKFHKLKSNTFPNKPADSEYQYSRNTFEQPVSNLNGVENNLPITTQSEYMGAVNLDMENCKCLQRESKSIWKNKINENITVEKDMPSATLAYKCINSDLCNCKKSIESKRQKSNRSSITSKNQSSSKNVYSPINVLITDQNLSKKTNQNSQEEKNMPNSTEILDQKEIEKDDINKVVKTSATIKDEYVITSDINNFVKTELFPCDCDYYVKFLGVTLANSNSNKTLNCNINQDLCKRKGHNSDYIKESKSFEKRTGVPEKLKQEKTKDDGDIHNKSDVQACTCLCGVKCDELRSYMSATLGRQRGEHSKNENKELNEKCFKENVIDNEETCICCNDKLDESQDLEVNTFHLLEEHLKSKLDEFRVSCCKSSCIPPEDEDKLFTTILDKVKQVISESANKVTCKCPGGKQIEGSWNRAYSLLQEYLKTKIKRVECLCTSQDETTQESFLPNVLNKICNLIENDFQRLKDICKCQNIDMPTAIRMEMKSEIPEKDTNSMIEYSNQHSAKEDQSTIIQTGVDDVKQLSKLNSNSSIVLKQSLSAQVSLNIGMETKSCEAIEKENKNVQTSYSKKIFSNKSCSCFKRDSCYFNNGFKYKPIKTKHILVHHVNAGETDVISNIPSEFIDSQNACCQIKSSPHIDIPNSNIIKEKDTKYSQGQETIELDITNSESDKNNASPYIGYTVECSCDAALGTCTCIKSAIARNDEQIGHMWENVTHENLPQDISYIMDGIPKKDKNKHVSYDIPYENCKEIASGQYITKKIEPQKILCESQVSVHDEEDIVLKDSDINLKVSYNTANTSDDNVTIERYSNAEDRPEFLEFGYVNLHIQQNKQQNSSINTANTSKHNMRNNSIKSETYITDSKKTSKSQYSSCDCNLVPACHVKMLVDNIENKLAQCQCICDSLSLRVCPVHTKKYC